MSQEKHVIILHCKEDRDVFINKIKFPKTVFHGLEYIKYLENYGIKHISF